MEATMDKKSVLTGLSALAAAMTLPAAGAQAQTQGERASMATANSTVKARVASPAALNAVSHRAAGDDFWTQAGWAQGNAAKTTRTNPDGTMMTVNQAIKAHVASPAALNAVSHRAAGDDFWTQAGWAQGSAAKTTRMNPDGTAMTVKQAIQAHIAG
jgi:hypothetical protein